MRRMPRATYFWPGLPQLWAQGGWGSLCVALTAATLLNVAILASFAWSELLAPVERSVLWGGLGLFWIGAAVTSEIARRRDRNPDGDAFARATELCLQGDYCQAEEILTDLLRQDVRDVEARLSLATLMRHMGRREEALEQLELLVRFDGSQRWEAEIRSERERLAESELADSPFATYDSQSEPSDGDPPAEAVEAA